MDPLVESWVRSGKSPQLLYKGSTEDIITDLKTWVERRKTYNNKNFGESWDAFRAMDSFQQIAGSPEGFEQGQAPGVMDQMAVITASHISSFTRAQILLKEKNRENHLAKFLLASLRHRGVRWPRMPCNKRCQVDADVCAILGSVDQDFNSEMELEILEDRKRFIEWSNERIRRDAARFHAIANNPTPGVDTHPMGPLATRSRQAVANDPEISATQALEDAVRTPGNTTVYIADMLGNISVAGGENKPTTGDSSSSNVAADTPLNPDNPAATSSNTPDNTNKNAGPSSSTITVNGAKDQTLLGMKGPDEATKMSKAKKKREGRKRAKARAKEKAADAEDPVGNHND